MRLVHQRVSKGIRGEADHRHCTMALLFDPRGILSGSQKSPLQPIRHDDLVVHSIIGAGLSRPRLLYVQLGPIRKSTDFQWPYGLLLIPQFLVFD